MRTSIAGYATHLAAVDSILVVCVDTMASCFLPILMYRWASSNPAGCFSPYSNDFLREPVKMFRISWKGPANIMTLRCPRERLYKCYNKGIYITERILTQNNSHVCKLLKKRLRSCPVFRFSSMTVCQ